MEVSPDDDEISGDGTDTFERSAPLGANWTAVAVGNAASWPKKTAEPGDWIFIEMLCKCGESVGKVGMLGKTGAGIVSVEYRCPACGNNAWWRSAPRYI